MKILLVAGHGEGDPGACFGAYREAVLTREVVSAIEKHLEKLMEVHVFDMEKNLYKFLSGGGNVNFKTYDYVLEVHFNAGVGDATGNGRLTGTEILVHAGEKQVLVEEKILSGLTKLGFRNRGVKRRDDLLNMKICKQKYGVSYGLLEVCFIDDADDMTLFEKRKKEVAEAVAEGIAEGFGMKKSKKILVSANDIVWELNYAHFPIMEPEQFVKALDKAKKEGSPLYWGYYKLVNGIK